MKTQLEINRLFREALIETTVIKENDYIAVGKVYITKNNPKYDKFIHRFCKATPAQKNKNLETLKTIIEDAGI